MFPKNDETKHANALDSVFCQNYWTFSTDLTNFKISECESSKFARCYGVLLPYARKFAQLPCNLIAWLVAKSPLRWCVWPLVGLLYDRYSFDISWHWAAHVPIFATSWWTSGHLHCNVSSFFETKKTYAMHCYALRIIRCNLSCL